MMAERRYIENYENNDNNCRAIVPDAAIQKSAKLTATSINFMVVDTSLIVVE